MFIQNVLHESTPRLANQWPTQMSSKKRDLEFKKNAVSHMTSAGQPRRSDRDIVHASFMLEL